MKELLIKFIGVCLKDGVISDKEREVIMKKAMTLGVDQNECEKILYKMIEKNTKSATKTTTSATVNAIIIKKEYYDSGKLKQDGEFKDGKLNGLGKTYWENGNLWEEGEFKNGKLNGLGRTHREDGSVEQEGEFKDGKLNGLGKYFSRSGNLWEKGEFKDGRLNGYGKRFSVDGNIHSEGEFIGLDLNGWGKKYRDDGSVEQEGEFKDGKLNGKGIKYIYNGSVEQEGEFKNGELILKQTKEQEKKEVVISKVPAKENKDASLKSNTKEKDYSVYEKKGVPRKMLEDLKAGKINHIWYAKTIYYFTHDYNRDTIDIFIPSEGKMTRGSAKIWIKSNTHREELQSYNMRNGYALTKIEFIEFYEIK